MRYISETCTLISLYSYQDTGNQISIICTYIQSFQQKYREGPSIESVPAAVGVSIPHKVSQLAGQKCNKQTQDAVFERLISNANDTFLWVALMCQDFEKTAKRNVLKKLTSHWY